MPPVYNWFQNGVNIATGVDSLLLPQLQDGDQIKVSVTSSYPCLSPAFTFSDPLTFNHYPPLSANLTDGPAEVCAGIPVTLNMAAQGGDVSSYIYNWSAGNAVGPENTFTPVTSGYYYSAIDESCFDPITDSIYIEVLPVPVSDFSWEPYRPSVFVPYVKFTDLSVDALTWQWDLGDLTATQEQHPEHYYTEGGIFPVTLITTNDVGCTDTAVKMLEVENFITVYIPNSFTPNGDSRNDTFSLNGFSTGGYSMNVFNRWGQEVFRSSGDYDEWDGTFLGKDAPAGVYTYLFRVKNDASQKPYTGTVTLIR